MIVGFLLALTIGLLWTFTGVYYKLLAKWNLDFVKLSVVTEGFSLIVFLTFFTKTKELITGTITPPGWGYLVFVFASGIISFFSKQLHQISMKYGNSGITWAIGQSYLVIPFFAMILIYDEPYSWIKIIGNMILIAGAFILAIKPGQATKEGPRPKLGVALALFACLGYGVSSVMLSSTSHFPYGDAGQIRPALLTLGALTGIILNKTYSHNWNFSLSKLDCLLVVCQGIYGAIVLTLQIKALDILKSVSLSNMFYPIAVGTCIGSYALVSVLFFKEKSTPSFVLGILLIILGVLSYCFVR